MPENMPYGAMYPSHTEISKKIGLQFVSLYVNIPIYQAHRICGMQRCLKYLCFTEAALFVVFHLRDKYDFILTF